MSAAPIGKELGAPPQATATAVAPPQAAAAWSDASTTVVAAPPLEPLLLVSSDGGRAPRTTSGSRAAAPPTGTGTRGGTEGGTVRCPWPADTSCTAASFLDGVGSWFYGEDADRSTSAPPVGGGGEVVAVADSPWPCGGAEKESDRKDGCARATVRANDDSVPVGGDCAVGCGQYREIRN